jgi:intracellular multiplication protein IcmO
VGIERLVGSKDKFATTVADELIQDAKFATRYPPLERDFISAGELAEIVQGLNQAIREA